MLEAELPAKGIHHKKCLTLPRESAEAPAGNRVPLESKIPGALPKHRTSEIGTPAQGEGKPRGENPPTTPGLRWAPALGRAELCTSARTAGALCRQETGRLRRGFESGKIT